MFEKIVKSITALGFLLTVFAAMMHAQVCQPAPVGLVTWLTADGNALDSRSRNNGTLQNGATFGTGQSGQGFMLDGADDYIDLGDLTGQIASDWTVEAWINATSLSVTRRTIIGGFSDFRDWGIIINNNQLAVQYRPAAGGTVSLFSGVTPTLGTWYHLSATKNGGTVRIYVDGVERAVANDADPAYMPFLTSVRVGGEFCCAGTNFPGSIDEPSIYGRGLSGSEIAAIHAAGTAGKCKPTSTVSPGGQVGWWAGDGNADDATGTNNGTLQNGAGFAVSRVGQGFMFDGADDHIRVPSNPSLNPAASFTLEAWIFPTADSGGAILGKWGDSFGDYANQRAYLLSVPFGRKLRFSISNDANQSNGPFHIFDTPENAVNLNEWSLVTAVYDQTTGTRKIYVNGVLAATRTDAPITITNSISDLAIGGLYTSSTSFVAPFAGQIDEPSIYNRALTDTEIQSIFNAGLGGKLKETASTGVTATVGDVSVTYPSPGMRRTQEIPLEETDMPALPLGMTATGLMYDIATDAIPTGTTDLCFNLQAFEPLSNAEFLERRILHLEAGNWVNRTISWSFSTKTICARVPSLSPFAIVDSNIAPTAASVSVGGRAVTADGRGISHVSVSITDDTGRSRTALTNSFGYYRFDNVEVGETYVISVNAKRYQFETPTRTVNVVDELTNVDFTALSEGPALVPRIRRP